MRVHALLGPTNTGKTHLALDALGEHRDGVIGLPLRLLAREIYEALCRRHGAEHSALITGEERTGAPHARYVACTVEAMPERRALPSGASAPWSFVAVDEIQLCADRERGHAFTDRLLRRRGTETTMVMGADAMAPVLARVLGDDVTIERRARLSRLTHAGSKKLSRLPPKSAVVAFSIKDVYATAEEVRHHHGGCAVVTGAMSPATRNAQVGLFQRGEVPVLVATDAIGMGLNLDIDHVWFTAVQKFDGDDVRALTALELAQIAGRAGRHTQDGTFGVTSGLGPLHGDVVSRLERHVFPPIDALCFRNGDLDASSVQALLASLRAPPPAALVGTLVQGRPASDVLALTRLANDDDVMAHVLGSDDVFALFEHCQIPDFTKISPDEHTALVRAVWLMTRTGGVTDDWLSGRVTALGRGLARDGDNPGDSGDVDVDTLVGRLAHVRTLTYIAHRSTWVRDAAHWQRETRALEDRLSDALHARLTARFVDRLRTAVRGGGPVVAAVDDDGGVRVADEVIGRLVGLRFVPAEAGSPAERDLRVGAAAKGLGAFAQARAQAIVDAPDSAFAVDAEALTVTFDGAAVGRLTKGKSKLWPRAVPLTDGIVLDDGAWRARLEPRLTAAARASVARALPRVCALDAAAGGDDVPQSARAIVHALIAGLGICDRDDVLRGAGPLNDDARRFLRKAGVRLGFLDIYVDDAFKDRALRTRAALLSVWREASSSPALPPAGASSFVVGARPMGFVTALGFRVADVVTDDGHVQARAFRADLVDDVFALMKGLPLPASLPASAVERLGCSRAALLAVLAWRGYGVVDEATGAIGLLPKRRAAALKSGGARRGS